MTNNRFLSYIRLFVNARKEPYMLFKRLLGFYPLDIDLYRLALLSKSSFTKDKDGKLINNERLEFLGDAVLESVVTDWLYHQFPNKKEGFLTVVRSRIVQRKTLNKIGIQMGLNKLAKSACGVKPFNIYGNTFEAIVGAVYLDRGYSYAMRFVLGVIEKYINVDKIAQEELNYKVKLQEWAQKHKVAFRYVCHEEEGHKSKRFVMDVYVEGVLVGSGSALSKKEAQQKAAERAYKQLMGNGAVMKQLREKKNTANSPKTVEEKKDS